MLHGRSARRRLVAAPLALALLLATGCYTNPHDDYIRSHEWTGGASGLVAGGATVGVVALAVITTGDIAGKKDDSPDGPPDRPPPPTRPDRPSRESLTLTGPLAIRGELGWSSALVGAWWEEPYPGWGPRAGVRGIGEWEMRRSTRRIAAADDGSPRWRQDNRDLFTFHPQGTLSYRVPLGAGDRIDAVAFFEPGVGVGPVWGRTRRRISILDEESMALERERRSENQWGLAVEPFVRLGSGTGNFSVGLEVSHRWDTLRLGDAPGGSLSNWHAGIFLTWRP